MAQFELISKSDIYIKDPQTGEFTGERLKAGVPLCITLPDGKYSEGNLFASAKLNPCVLNAVNAKLGLNLTLDQFNASYWKIQKSST